MKDFKYEKYPNNNFKPKSIVVLMHGIGADALDLLPLAKQWSLTLNKTLFYSLYAPFSYDLGPSGFQWFGLEDRDQTRILKEIQSIKPMFENFLEKKLNKNYLTFNNLILVGFSQGTMVALNLGLALKKTIQGILGYSGGIIFSKSGKVEINSKPKICLIHGQNDEVVPNKMMEASKKALEEKNFEVDTHLLDGLGHSIDQQGLDIGQKFLVKNLLKC